MSDQATLEPAPAAPPVRPRRWGGRRVRLIGSLTGGTLVVVVTALVVWLPHLSGAGDTSASKVPVAWGRPAVSADGLVQRIGVKITRVAVSGGGGLLDLRYQVVDPDKANAIHDQANPPAIVDERTGLVINQLLMNHAHSGPYKPAVTYYLVFENTGNWVHHGSKVTVLLGNAQVEHVVVA